MNNVSCSTKRMVILAYRLKLIIKYKNVKGLLISTKLLESFGINSKEQVDQFSQELYTLIEWKVIGKETQDMYALVAVYGETPLLKDYLKIYNEDDLEKVEDEVEEIMDKEEEDEDQ